MSLNQLFQPNPGENLVVSLRRHPITFLKPVFLFVVMTALPFAAKLIFFQDKPVTVENPLLQTGGVLFISSYFLAVWLLFLTQFSDYYLDIDIVTNDRIIDIEQKGLFGRSISELDLSRIQDVHSEIKGIFPSLFNFGTVVVQTAGEDKNFVFEQVPDPHAVRQRILELAALDRKREARELMSEPDQPKQQGL